MEKLKRKHVTFKESICAFPNYLANLTRDITSLFGNKLVIFGCYI
jgi:hypothetical protein